jgi:hypothetical protein
LDQNTDVIAADNRTTTQNAIISATAEESRVNGGQADKAPCLALSLCVKWSVQKIAI